MVNQSSAGPAGSASFTPELPAPDLPSKVPPPNTSFGGLFDLSFSIFITTRIMRVLYGLAIGASIIVGLLGVVGGLIMGEFLVVLLTPILAAVGLVLTRLSFELTLVIFRIAELLKEIKDKG